MAGSRAKQLPILVRPGTPVPCRRGDKLLGTHVPGRNAGTVSGCAVPEKARPGRKENYEARVQFGLAGIGPTLRRSTARNRIRSAARGGPVVDDPVAVARIAHDQLRGKDALPYPTGLEYPHTRGASRCDPAHALWEALEDDIADARERVAQELPDDATEADYERATARLLADEHPQYREQAKSCAKAYEGREKARQGKALESQAKTRGRAIASYKRAGGDTSSADYLDEVLGALAHGSTKGRKKR